MTSKRLFLKGMREDLRHKIWMLALSLLGSFLTMPVMWLLRFSDAEIPSTGRPHLSAITATESLRAVNEMADVFREILLPSAGVIAILGAMIVGLESFRYLQQKSMVDTYHSLPVSRMQLFGIQYINGLLIWLVPYLFCTALTLAFSGILLARVGVTAGFSKVILEAVKNTAFLVIVFLMVYHLLLLATMLTGNMINTLAVAAILGLGAICAYGLTLGFMECFFRTYYLLADGLAAVTYCSPLAAPVMLLGSGMEGRSWVSDSLSATALSCLGVALVLGVLAWFSYLKRPSEYAGRGLELRWIAAPLRLVVSIMGGMGGWLFMYYLVGAASRTAWCIFGALLIGILAYGVLDVIFSMDFKAFFRHKWSMAAAMVIMLLVCFGFQGDWMGYDRYLPEQGQIREASIFSRSYTNSSRYYPIFDGIELTDAAQIHAFLERGIGNMYGPDHKPESIQVQEAYRGDTYATDTFYVRVVMNNGRSYYRVYDYYEWDEDVVLPLLCSEEYAKGAYCLTEETIDACISMMFFSGADHNDSIAGAADKQIFRELAEAYNRDLMEQPRSVILGEGRLLGQIRMSVQTTIVIEFTLDILDGMTHTLEALERNGIRILEQPTDAKEVESITFTMDGLSRYWYEGNLSISPAERSIRSYFGVYPERLPAAQEQLSDSRPEQWYRQETYTFTISDPAEIEQLLPLIQYSSMRHRVGIFIDDFVKDVSILDNSGVEWSVCLRKGALPEEYIQRFLEEAGN